MSHYGKSEYWDERYTKQPEPFDWYQIYTGIKDVITQHIQKNHRILNIGAGNSRLSEDMYEDGFQNIFNIDISYIVAKNMEEKYKTKCPNMQYQQMDVLDMKFKNGEFDIVVDKGTLDSVLCGDNSAPNVDKMLNEIYRVLTPTGIYICVTYGVEEQRKDYFKNHDWEIKVDKVAKPSSMISSNINNPDEKDPKNFHYIYILTKGKK